MVQVQVELKGVYMIPGRLSHRREFTPVLSLSSVFVYMISPKKVTLGRLTPARVHQRFLHRSENFFPARNLATVSNRSPCGLERVAHAYFS